MMSSYGNSSSGSPTSGSSDEDLRKRKRMESNRESAKRSRMRKQQHLEELKAQAAQLRNENDNISRRVNFTTQQLVSVEAENAFLRAQVIEFTQSLNSLMQILDCVNSYNLFKGADDHHFHEINGSSSYSAAGDGLLNSSWNFVGFSNQQQQQQYPIMASPLMFDY